MKSTERKRIRYAENQARCVEMLLHSLGLLVSTAQTCEHVQVLQNLYYFRTYIFPSVECVCMYGERERERERERESNTTYITNAIVKLFAP